MEVYGFKASGGLWGTGFRLKTSEALRAKAKEHKRQVRTLASVNFSMLGAKKCSSNWAVRVWCFPGSGSFNMFPVARMSPCLSKFVYGDIEGQTAVLRAWKYRE